MVSNTRGRESGKRVAGQVERVQRGGGEDISSGCRGWGQREKEIGKERLLVCQDGNMVSHTRGTISSEIVCKQVI